MSRECYEAASRAYAGLIALDPLLASRGLFEGCRREWRFEPGRFWAGIGLERLDPRARLSAVAAAAARAAALRELQGVEAEGSLLVAALEAYAASVLRRLGLPPVHPAPLRLLLGMAAPSASTPRGALDSISSSLAAGGFRAAAARILLRLLSPRLALIDRGAGRGRGPLTGSAVPGEEGDDSEVEALSRLVYAGLHWRRSFIRPPKRLAGLPDDVVVSGRDRLTGELLYMLDVSASMRPGEVARGLAVAERLWRLYPAASKRLVLFDYGVRRVLSSPGEASEEHLVPWGGTSLSKAIEELRLPARPCRGLLAVYSDWGLEEADLEASLRFLRRLSFSGCSVALLGPKEPPRGPWLSLASHRN